MQKARKSSVDQSGGTISPNKGQCDYIMGDETRKEEILNERLVHERLIGSRDDAANASRLLRLVQYKHITTKG